MFENRQSRMKRTNSVTEAWRYCTVLHVQYRDNLVSRRAHIICLGSASDIQMKTIHERGPSSNFLVAAPAHSSSALSKSRSHSSKPAPKFPVLIFLFQSVRCEEMEKSSRQSNIRFSPTFWISQQKMMKSARLRSCSLCFRPFRETSQGSIC